MQGKKKLRLTTKQNLAEPVTADEIRLISVCVDFRTGSLIIQCALIDSDGGPNGGPKICSERSIHIGLNGITGIDIDKFEQDILAVVGTCGVLPAGGKIENK